MSEKNEAFKMAADNFTTAINTLELSRSLVPPERTEDLEFTLRCHREALELLPTIQKLEYSTLCSSLLKVVTLCMEGMREAEAVSQMLDICLQVVAIKHLGQSEELAEELKKVAGAVH